MFGPQARRGIVLRKAILLSLVASPALAQPSAPPTAAEQPASPTPAEAAAEADRSSVKPPEVLQQVAPEYPAAARDAGLRATVELRLDIGRDGKVTRAEVVEPQGHGFDEAALRAAQQLTFRPAERDGQPLAVRILFRYQFELEKPPALANASFLGKVILRSGTGSPLGGASILLSQDGVAISNRVSGADGSFRLDSLPAGTYQVAISLPGFRTLTENLQLEADHEAIASYALEPEAATGAAIDVTVAGTRVPADVSYRRVEARELAHVPGNRGDALQALENLPGVARPPTLSGLLIVHGTSPESSQIFVDGTYVPSMYHFGGLSSVIPTEMLDHVDFFTGNYGVRYGRGAGGIVDIAIRRARDDGKYHGLFQVDLLDARAQLEGPVPASDHWRFLAGVRRSHVDLWLIPLLENQDTSFQAAPVYYDYQAFVETTHGHDSYLRFGIFGSDDRLRLTNRASAAGGQLDQVNSFWNLQLLHEARLGPKVDSRTEVSVGYFRQKFSFATIRSEFVAHPVVVRNEITAKLTDELELHFGPDLLYSPLQSDFAFPSENGPSTPDSGSFLLRPLRMYSDGTAYFRPAFFVELRADPVKRLHVVPGLRLDYTHDSERVDLSPRISAKYDLVLGPRKTVLKGGYGFFYEPPQIRQTLTGYGSPDLRSVRALQASLGVEQQLSEQLSLSVEGFHIDLSDLITSRPNAEGRVEYQNVAEGNVIGGELLLRYEADEHFFGWLSYTLSRSTRRWGPGEPEVAFEFDQTHIMAAVASYRLGRGWELGARLRAVSGNPVTPCVSGLYTSFENAYVCVNGAYQSQRAAPFYELDLRAEKRWQLSEQTSITAYLEVINATARENDDIAVYSFDYAQKGYTSSNLPLLPNLGIRMDF